MRVFTSGKLMQGKVYEPPKRKLKTDWIGKTINELTVVSLLGIRVGKPKLPYWLCQCSCGNTTEVAAQTLKNGTLKSCGCSLQKISAQKKEEKIFGDFKVLEISKHKPVIRYLLMCVCGVVEDKSRYFLNLKQPELNKCGHFVHRGSHRKTGTKVYSIWTAMKGRCYRVNSRGYKWYGALGITVCERWHKFENFYADMGDPPTATSTIERLDPTKNYCPENCTWLEAKLQGINKRNTVRINYKGVNYTTRELSEKLQVKMTTLVGRIYLGVPVEDLGTQGPLPKVRNRPGKRTEGTTRNDNDNTYS